MAKVLIVVEDVGGKDGTANVQVSVQFDPPVADTANASTYTAAQRIGNNAIEYALKRPEVKKKEWTPLPRHSH